jgi:hypothetical protein
MEKRHESREFVWPVPTSELDAIEVFEHADEAVGHERWRRHEEVAALAADAMVFAPVALQPHALPASDARRSWLAGAAMMVVVLAVSVLLVVGLAVTRVQEAARDTGRIASPAAPAADATALVASSARAIPQPTLGLAVPPLKAPATAALPSDVPRRPAVAAVAPPTPSRPAPAVPTITVAPKAAAKAASKAEPPAVVPPPPSETPAVLEAVRRYAEAWNRLDARATQAIWPSADRAQLVERFTAIREQRLTLSGCSTSVDGARATVSCLGTLRYRPRLGDHTTRVQQGPWWFGLDRSSGAWLIDDVNQPAGTGQ